MEQANTTPSAFDFTTHLDRWNTHSAKWDLLAAHLGPDALSLSVADMEFRTAPCVRDAVVEAALHGTYGYTEVFDDFRDAAARWQHLRHGWDVSPDDVHFFPRIVQVVRALLTDVLPTRIGHTTPVVVSTTPAYGPILEVVRRCGAELRLVPLAPDAEGTWRFEADDLDRALDGAHLLLWCNPHNPTGRVWSEDELATIARLAAHHDVIVLDDDIHADFTRPGRTPYVPTALAAPDLWDSGRLIQCTSPGKTFSIAGLESSAILVADELGAELETAKRRAGLHNPNYFAIPATIAAWTRGEAWVDALQLRLDTNLTRTVTHLREALPTAKVTDPEGTYLVWVDAREILTHPDQLSEACRAARVAVTPGDDFGEEWDGYFRLNTALPPAELDEALHRLCTALVHQS